MEKKAIIFLDFNETFDDLCDSRGKIFFWSLANFINHFDDKVDIAVITSAPYNNPKFNIRPDFIQTSSYFTKRLRESFKYLIEQNNGFITPIKVADSAIQFGKTKVLCSQIQTKKEGVEEFLRRHRQENYTTCVFAGNNEESDLIMMDADIDVKEKYFILANKRVLKTDKYPVYKLSLVKNIKSCNYGKEALSEVGKQDQLIFKTSTKSYGLGKGFEALTGYLKEKERQF